jgi:hypothetical protein
MMSIIDKMIRPGHIAPAVFFALAALAVPSAVSAQAAPPPPSIQPVPTELELAKLIWGTMVAVEQANVSGNYSVLRDMASPSFQQLNDPARLAQIFAEIRASRIDLSNTLLLAPTYVGTPQQIEDGAFGVRGYFGLRPTAVGFELYYQWVNGRWRLYGIGLNPQPLATIQPADTVAPPPAPPPEPQPRRRRN